MIGLDTSYLVAVTLREHPAHKAAWQLFEREIRGHDGSVALAPQALAEFVHVVTDHRRFERPLEVDDALAVAEKWWNASECRQVPADREAVSIFLDWMTFHRLGRKRLLDTLLAACYRAAGITRLATTGWRDFEVYGAFELLRMAPSSED